MSPLCLTCRDKIREILGEDVELFSFVNGRRRKDIENPARGIVKITKHGNVQCIAGYNMVFLSKEYNMDAYMGGVRRKGKKLQGK